MKKWQFSSFRDRLLCFLLALVVIILSAVFLAVDIANTRNAQQMISDSLDVSANTLAREISNRSQHLIQTTRMLSGDFAFKEAFFTKDMATTASALENHRRRINADVMMVTDIKGNLMAHTRITEKGQQFDAPPSLKSLIDFALEESSQTYAMMILLNGIPFQMVAVPLLAPRPSGWFLVGFRIDNSFAKQLGQDTRTDVSIAFKASNDWSLIATTLKPEYGNQLIEQLKQQRWEHQQSTQISLKNNQFIIKASRLQAGTQTPIMVVQQRSLTQALTPYQRIRTTLLNILLVAFLIALLITRLIANSVTKPVRSLLQFTDEVNAGNYGQILEINRDDEIGQLISSFNKMSLGLEERDKVRDLLGKVVSPEIAHELLSKNIELGGEDKEVTVLFTDLRGFTTLSESLEPKELLELLNRYLTVMSQCIEAEGGVIDKYIGDAIMAIFGAPLNLDNEASRAIRTALAMKEALIGFNEELAKENIAPLAIGIGISTGKVVAGNMGSETRLNYTVIGDTVNLASRLESLTKYYGEEIIVSESTSSKASGFVYQTLDKVKVKGKRHSIRISAPRCHVSEITQECDRIMANLDRAITYYQKKMWDQATTSFQTLAQSSKDDTLPRLYLDRIEQLRTNPPEEDWDGTYEFNQK